MLSILCQHGKLYHFPLHFLTQIFIKGDPALFSTKMVSDYQLCSAMFEKKNKPLQSLKSPIAYDSAEFLNSPKECKYKEKQSLGYRFAYKTA